MEYKEAIYQLTNFEGTYETPSLEAVELAIEALKKVERLEETYHNFLGYDLSKCVKYGNTNEEQRIDSYSTLMMYEIAQVFDDLLD